MAYDKHQLADTTMHSDVSKLPPGPFRVWEAAKTAWAFLDPAGIRKSARQDLADRNAVAAEMAVDGNAGSSLVMGHGSSADPYLGATTAPPPGSVGGLRKRALDLAVAVATLIAVLPLLVLVWAAVKASLGGRAFFVQQRVGLGGRMFPCIKFRTMCVDADKVLERHLAANPHAAAEWAQTQKLMDDPRVTALGRILRKTSIDELPQLINVIRGDMSCVGPRPVLSDELQRYGVQADTYRRARPGLTGLWQVSGRSKLSYQDRVALDCQYVEHWSLLLDLKILAKTVVVLANHDETA